MKLDKKNTKSSKYKYWQNHFLSWQQSGLSQRSYCMNNNLAISTFSYWKRKVEKNQNQQIHFYPLSIQPNNIPVKEDIRSGLRLLLSDTRYQIELESDFSSASLKKLLLILEEV